MVLHAGNQVGRLGTNLKFTTLIFTLISKYPAWVCKESGTQSSPVPP